MSDARIQLSNGTLFDLLQPDPETIEIEPIAHALSQLCRFTGHTTSFYSVAQHCVVVSRLVPADVALNGLLHDATEAFVGDVSTPLKALLPQYKAIELGIEIAIRERFDLRDEGTTVKHADKVAMATERRDLGLPGNDEYWHGLPAPAPFAIVPLEPKDARVAFLARFAEIVLHPGQGQAPTAPTREELMERVPRGPEERKRYESNKDTSERLAREEEDSPPEWMEVVG